MTGLKKRRKHKARKSNPFGLTEAQLDIVDTMLNDFVEENLNEIVGIYIDQIADIMVIDYGMYLNDEEGCLYGGYTHGLKKKGG